ncbi:DivIVA domain-containing protein [Paenibacillus silvisoli]|uniref:DivIVA domain-containing protein n=1 Tax=Paenibacillus silvisoli TaxID=3110539 RepID=UPI002805E564|nr:DivIVA domain-containing protein [Paenibacillus silvisoli]
MLFDQLMQFQDRFPQLKKACQEQLDRGYSIIEIKLKATSDYYGIVDDHMDVIMENGDGERILLNASKGVVHFVYLNDLPPAKERLHERIALHAGTVRHKKFKNQLMGGYRQQEVDHFLDLIVNDYREMEKLLREL